MIDTLNAWSTKKRVERSKLRGLTGHIFHTFHARKKRFQLFFNYLKEEKSHFCRPYKGNREKKKKEEY